MIRSDYIITDTPPSGSSLYWFRGLGRAHLNLHAPEQVVSNFGRLPAPQLRPTPEITRSSRKITLLLFPLMRALKKREEKALLSGSVQVAGYPQRGKAKEVNLSIVMLTLLKTLV